MVSEREVKRIIAGCIPDRQFKAEAREAIAHRRQEFMEEFIKSILNYTKTDSENEGREYHYSGIAKRSFNFGYKVASKFRLSEADAKMENGLLTITIPYSPHVVTKPQSITIK